MADPTREQIEEFRAACGIKRKYLIDRAENWTCETCGYKGRHDAHPGCRRAAPPRQVSEERIREIAEAHVAADKSHQVGYTIVAIRTALAESAHRQVSEERIREKAEGWSRAWGIPQGQVERIMQDAIRALAAQGEGNE